MLFNIHLLALVSAAVARSVRPPILEQEPYLDPSAEAETYKIPTIHESAVLARRVLHLTAIGTLVSTFPGPGSASTQDEDSGSQELAAFESRPAAIAGSPIGLMEYYADCEPDTGNPTLLAINIATPYRNYEAGSNVSFHIRWWPTQKNTYASFLTDEGIEEAPTPHTPTALPRFSLHGYFEDIPPYELAIGLIPACFVGAHPDSILWQPGNAVHDSHYVRFVVEHVYWLGGYGDRARIGWLPIEEWRNVTKREIAEARLPGERKHSHPDWLDEQQEDCLHKHTRERAKGKKWLDWLSLRGLADW